MGVRRSVRRTIWIIASFCALPAALPAAAAQSPPPAAEPPSFVNQQRVFQDELRQRYEQELTSLQKISFDFGGWYNLYAFQFDDGVNSSRTLRRHDLRLWTRLGFGGGAHEIYARGRLSLLDFNHGDAFDGNEDDIDGPNLERGYYRFDLARSGAADALLPPGGNVTLKLGRDLAVFGHGIALAENLDQVLLSTYVRNWRLDLLAGKSVGSNLEPDVSRTAARTHRTFLGGELRYKGFDRHEPFAYVLAQRDRNHRQIDPPDQKFDYDSNYAGIGATGEVLPRLRYALEGVYEWGRSFGDGESLRDNRVDAWALLAELEYLFPGKHRPRASLEYLFGSGDPERRLSPTNSDGGNSGDFTDNSFVAFGFRDTGLSFAPRYANLHMWRAGAAGHPWPDHPRFRRLEVGGDWFLYHKHHREAAVSDPTADVASGYLGWEMDYYVNWEAAADLFWTARLGVFFPGRAFSDQTTRTFLLLGVTWSF